MFIKMLESVHEQSCNNIEHIIIDGASKDGTVSLLKKYQEMGWIKYISEPDNGIYDAMNKGIIHAEGKYINFMNSDDCFCNPDAIKKALNLLEMEKADYLYADANMVGENNQVNWVFSDNISLFWQRMPFCHQTMFCRKDVLLKEGCFNTNYILAADYELIIRLIFHDYKGTYLPLSIVNFSESGATIQQERRSKIEMAFIYYELYKSFYNFKDVDEALKLICCDTVDVKFIHNFLNYMRRKKLKNFNYSDFEKKLLACSPKETIVLKIFKYIKLFSMKITTNKEVYYFLNLIPVWKIKKSEHKKKTRHYLFGIIPILKIKR